MAIALAFLAPDLVRAVEGRPLVKPHCPGSTDNAGRTPSTSSAIIFRRAWRFGIVSKRLGSPYRSGRAGDWVESQKTRRCPPSRASGGGLGRMRTRQSEINVGNGSANER